MAATKKHQSSKPIVYIVQRRLTHYRAPFFNLLRAELCQAGMELHVVHGQPAPDEISKCDEGVLPWAEQVTNKYWRIGGKYLCWQKLPKNIRKADLTIIVQENRILSNLPLLLKRRYSRRKIAFWGHGANLQSSNPDGVKEKFKRWAARQVDWWFAYTDLSVGLLRECGFPAERITNLENAIDTRKMREDMSTINPRDVAALRNKLGWNEGHIGIFLGSLYAVKRLDFLFQAADRLHSGDPLFRLIILGDGPLRETVKEYCIGRPWSVWVGAKTGREKLLHLAVADVLLNPGGIGLAILDAFAAGLPIVTTDSHGHGPEISYLHQNENGQMTKNTLDSYVAGVRQMLYDRAYHTRLVDGCHLSALHYTIENMVQNYRDGIIAALAT